MIKRICIGLNFILHRSNLFIYARRLLEIEENIVEIFKIVTDYICFFCSSFKKKYIL